MDDSRHLTCRLSKSGKAVLFFDEFGNTFMTSVAWLIMLAEGRARGNMILANHIGETSSDRFGKPKSFDKLKVRVPSDGSDPLSRQGLKNVKDCSVKVKSDDW